MTLPDPMTEIKKFIRFVTIINPNNPFTHIGKWNFIDQMSTTDDGQVFNKMLYKSAYNH